MKTFKTLLLIIPSFCLLACNNKVDLKGYNNETQTAIKDFVKAYGNQENAYIVSDFDNTTSIFDITYQCSVYQIETMSFALSSEELRTTLLTNLDVDDTVNKYVNDITSAYTHLTYFSKKSPTSV